MEQTTPATRKTDEFDVPLGGLPQSGWMQLTDRGHIEGASAEVRFVAEASDLNMDVATAVWRALGGATAYPVLEPAAMQAHSVTVTPTGAQAASTVNNGWRLGSADGQTNLVLFSNLIALQTRDYPGYSGGLGDRLKAALEAFAAATDRTIVSRIGLRYINRLTDPRATEPAFWRRRVRPAFAGALADEHLAARVAAVHQQLELRLDEVAAARVISGAIEQEDTSVGRFGFMIDIDVFREEAIPFDVTAVANLTRQLNRTALSLFTRVLTEDSQDALGPVRQKDGA